MSQLRINSWIKSPCGRSKYKLLAEKEGFPNKLRLIWFVIFAAIRDWNLITPDQPDKSESS